MFFADDSEVEAEAEDANKVVDEISNEEKTVVDSYNFAQNYAEDTKKQLWCEITFAVSMHYCKEILLSNIVISCYCLDRSSLSSWNSSLAQILECVFL